MKPASSKAKGRTFQKIVAAIVCEAFNLPAEDCRPAIMGEQGCDLKLSAAARARFPYGVECKKRERLDVWAAIAQAEANANKEGLAPVLVFARNRSPAYAVVPLATFVELAKGRAEEAEP